MSTTTTYDVSQYATVYTGSTEVHRFDDGQGTTYLAAESDHGDTHLLDDCGYVTIAPAPRHYRNQVEARPCCRWCVSVGELADRINRAHDEQPDGHREEAATAMLKVIQRTGSHAHAVAGGRDWAITAHQVSTPDDLLEAFRHDGVVIVSEYDTEAYAREITAHRNGTTWTVGTMETAHIDDTEDDYLTPDDCTDEVGGIVWANVDNYGYSSPTAEEVRNYI